MALGPGLYTKTLPAPDVLEKFLDVAERLFPKQPVTIDVTLAPEVTFRSESTTGRDLRARPDVIEFVGSVKARPYLTAKVVHLTHVRAPQGQQDQAIRYETADGIVAKLDMIAKNDPDRTRFVFGAVEVAKETFAVTPYVDLVRSGDKSLEATMQLRERGVSELESILKSQAQFQQSLIEQEAIARRKRDEEDDVRVQARQAALEEAHAAKMAELDAIQRERDMAHKAREDEHDKLLKSFVTHEPKYMRREIQKALNDMMVAAKEFKVSEETSKKRTPFTNAVTLLVLFAAAVAITMTVLIVMGANDWRIFTALTASSATVVTTMVYFMKWSDRWFREHADAEFAATRLRADILRASWVAELAAEWQTADDERELPPELVQAFTRNIFRDAGGTRESEHPLEALTGMMKRITSVEIGKGGTISVQGDDGAPRLPKPKPAPKKPRAKKPTGEDDEEGEHAESA